MKEIRTVKLELLRPGPAHNQLLSPLTPYLALCGADGPVTINIPFEHRQLLARLERLRYISEGREIGPEQREGEVREMGEALGRVLSQVPALLSEIGSARSAGSELVHLRLSMAAYELALVPFELAIGTDGFPGSGAPLVLQSIAPIALTREVRRGHPLPVSWDRRPRLLFAFASPPGFDPVPAQDHLEALRRAIDPWVKWRKMPEERVAEVKGLLTLLPDASLQDIRRACAENEYTHVHILAHGAPIGQGGDHRHYGVALRHEGDGVAHDVVSGEALATALTSRDQMGGARARPTMVTLATCDSGHPGSVITPGGSLAHAVHAAGIPWVVASQFPLWMAASSVAVEAIYRGILRGDDPRWVLHTLRQRLRTDSAGTHDWASIVAYAEVPWDFDTQVEAFRDHQMRRLIETKFDEAEQRLASLGAADRAQAPEVEHSAIDAAFETIRSSLVRWRQALSSDASAHARAERLGISAASEKRIGEQLAAREDKTPEAREAFERACELYGRAVQMEPSNHWVITQYLSMKAVLAGADLAPDPSEDYGTWWTSARQIARWDLLAASGVNRAWALATLAELELLGAIYGGRSFDRDQSLIAIARMCREIHQAAGADTFPVFATRRQFERYARGWRRREWADLADKALESLPKVTSWTGRTHPGE